VPKLHFALVFLSLLSFPGLLQAQFLTPQYHATLAPYVVYLEIGGNGDKFSLNYEQVIAQGDFLGATARFGLGAFPVGEQRVEMSVPVTTSVIIGGGSFLGELGGGARLGFSNQIMEEGVDIIPTGIAGIRYHPSRRGGMFLRLAYTPSYFQQTLQHWGGLGIGFGFNR
jgi:hypothetical protein